MDDEPLVTNYDEDAQMLAVVTAMLPDTLTLLAYVEAVKLHAALMERIEGFEKAMALERMAGGL